MKQKRKAWWQTLLFLSFILSFYGCKDDKNDETALTFDPSQKVEITGFNPESAGGGANFFVYGKNFGTDPSIIQVTVNDKKAVVISSDGTTIYCMVPERAGIGPVKVKIGTESIGIQEAVSEKDFQYKGVLRVNTLIGWVDKDGHSTTLDGPFDKAQFREPAWLCFGETKNEIYVVEQVGVVRKIDLVKKEVTTLFSNSGDLNHPRTLSFSLDYDTLYISNDRDNDVHGMAVAYALKKDGYKKWARLVTGNNCNGADVNPIDGNLFYNCYKLGQLYKWKKGTQEGKFLYRAGDIDWEYYVQFEPEGNFAYLVCRNRGYLMKAFYNWDLRELVVPSVFAGSRSHAGYADGVGTNAQFNQPNQGCFDKNKNFYLCDVDNHCIRKITPDGLVTTFAGRPREAGYSDGSLRNQAQFRFPVGILYDEENETFYIADCINHRIRTIKAE